MLNKVDLILNKRFKESIHNHKLKGFNNGVLRDFSYQR